MTLADAAVAALRTFLTEGRSERFQQLRDEVERNNAVRHWNVLVTAATAVLVHLKFGAERRGDEIVRWVAAVRTRPGVDPAELDPVLAEGCIRVCLGEVSTTATIADRLTATFQETLLRAFVDDFGADELDVDSVVVLSVDHAADMLVEMDKIEQGTATSQQGWPLS